MDALGHHGVVEKPDESYGYLLWIDSVYNAARPLAMSRVQILQLKDQRWVKAGDIYGLARAYTSTHVYVLWRPAPDTYREEWLPANDVHSIPEDEWHGLPLVD